MDNDSLQRWVEEISWRSFNQPFRHQAAFNKRLRSTGGRYFTKSHHIEISWMHYETFGQDETERIIKHELCHYHLHLQRRGFRHRDPEFKALLQKVGGSRYCSTLTINRAKEPFRYKLLCSKCGMEYLRKRKVDPKKYVCGRCQGKLLLKLLDTTMPS
ncbi:MAG: SprT family protein [Paenibacillus sp.]|nr:SprT family protein [Paenibacillus sp.]